MDTPLFADIILPLAIPRRYTYLVPAELVSLAEVGKRAMVQFGKNKVYAGIIAHLHHSPPGGYEAKAIFEIIDEQPIVTAGQFNLWKWISDYYLCTEGEVMLAALPAGLRLESETLISLYRYEEGETLLDDQEYLVTEALMRVPSISIKEVSEITGLKYVYPLLRRMVEKKIITVTETVREKFRPLMETIVSISKDADDESHLEEIFTQLEKRAPKQLEVLMRFVTQSARYQERKQFVLKTQLIGDDSNLDSALKALEKKGILVLTKREAGRIDAPHGDLDKGMPLSPAQQKALEEIDSFLGKKPVLLHGLTGSGKTLIYEKLITRELDAGRHALYLLPEIALTTQMIQRLRMVFGKRVLLYHSRISDAERVETWNLLLKDNTEPVVVIGARSALFLPVRNPGIIIVDEEHEPSYKQQDPAPRYQARDTAVVLANQTQTGILLGSATPSVDSYFNALREKYALVKLDERYGGATLPSTEIVDLKKESKRKKMHGNFSPQLIEAIEKMLAEKKQVILFQNRRGYAPLTQCETCAWVPYCVQCDIPLTLHRHENKLMCHLCGFRQTPVSTCEACGSPTIRTKGFGTERIEEDLRLIFPEARVGRMDHDSTRGKYAFQQIVKEFSDGETNILVGTQMLTKGFDFSQVGLVGILNADALLHFPEYRAYERAFQLMVQVSGRAGRKGPEGKVVIQTWQPDHPVIGHVIRTDYESMLRDELTARQQFKYPPYYKLIRLTLKHKKEDHLDAAARLLQKDLSRLFGDRVMGPDTPSVSRIKNNYIRGFMLRFLPRENAAGKEKLKIALHYFASTDKGKSVRVAIDCDP